MACQNIGIQSWRFFNMAFMGNVYLAKLNTESQSSWTLMLEFRSFDHPSVLYACVCKYVMRICSFCLLVCQVFLHCSLMEYWVSHHWFNDKPVSPLLQHAMRAYRYIYIYIYIYNEELSDLYSLPNIVRVVKSRRMRWVGHVARMGQGRGVYKVLGGKPEGKNHWRDPGTDGRIILGWIFRKWEGVVGTGWSWLTIGTGGGHLWVQWWTFGFQKCGEFLD